jgi:hypothetical protein
MESIGDRPPFRPARTLIGWLDPQEAVLTQAGRQTQDAGKPEYELRARQARLAAGARRFSVDPLSVVTEAPPPLHAFKADFEAHPRAELIMAEGWRVALIDLRGVVAMQPTVLTDVQVPEVDPEDFAALAGVTLGMPPSLDLNVQYEKERKAWIIVAPSPNFRIEQHFETEVDGNLGLGFTVRLLPSFLSAVRIQDRYVLKDGYHRAVALLARGINVVPGLVREGSVEDIGGRPGMFSAAALLGASPPVIPDYLDDDVSTATALPVTRRLIVIQGLETNLAE